MLTAGTYQALIVVELTADATELIPAPSLLDVQGWWPVYEAANIRDPDRRLVGPRLQYLYTKRHAIQRMMGDAWQDTAISLGGAQLNESSPFDKLQKLYDTLTAEIEATEMRGSATRPPVVAAMTTVTPAYPLPQGVPDPADSLYRGDPLKPDWWRQ